MGGVAHHRLAVSNVAQRRRDGGLDRASADTFVVTRFATGAVCLAPLRAGRFERGGHGTTVDRRAYSLRKELRQLDVPPRAAHPWAKVELLRFGKTETLLQISNSELVCLDALACLQAVGADVHISDNGALQFTRDLTNLTSVGGERPASIFVGRNAALEELEGFALEGLAGGLTVWRNPALHAILGFDRLRQLKTLSILENPSLQSLQGLVDLATLDECTVNHNSPLCISEIFEVCGDIELGGFTPGGTQFNDDTC